MQRKKEFIVNFLYICVIVIIAALAIKYLLEPLLPFIIAYIVVSVSSETINKLTFGIFSKKTASVIFTFLLVVIIAWLLYMILYGLISETTRLYETFNNSELITSFTQRINDYFESFDKGSFIYKGFTAISKYFSDYEGLIKRLWEEYMPVIISALMKIISFFPTAILFIFVLFISMFYIGYDYDKITSFLTLQLSDKMLETLREAKRTLFSTAKELFKAYFLLTFITFIQLLVGFLILGIDYAFILALIICFVDLLPILGTGTVLFPWALFCFLLGDFKRAVGLLVLYAVISIFRQVAEPKIVGANIGLSPLLSLVSIFAGLKLMGFWGLVVFPIILITVIRLNEKGLIRLYRNFPEKGHDKIDKSRRKFLDFKRNDK